MPELSSKLVSVVDMLSHIVMLYLLLSLSYGSGSPSTNKVAYISNFQQLRNQPAAKAIAVIAIVQVSSKIIAVIAVIQVSSKVTAVSSKAIAVIAHI